MKKLIAIITFTALVAVQAAAQRQSFNHLSLAPTIGLDGIGFSAATPVTPHFQLRAGFSFIPYAYKGSPDILPASIDIDGQERPFRSAVTMRLMLNTGGIHLLADLYPSASKGFHFTAGLYTNTPSLMYADIDASRLLSPDEYASYGIQINKDDYRTNVTTDTEGHVKVALRYNSIRPYLGLGFGRAVSDKRVSVTFDMGLLYMGKPYVRTYDYSVNKNGTPVIITSETLGGSDRLDTASNLLHLIESVPVMPVLKLNVFIKTI